MINRQRLTRPASFSSYAILFFSLSIEQCTIAIEKISDKVADNPLAMKT